MAWSWQVAKLWPFFPLMNNLQPPTTSKNLFCRLTPQNLRKFSKDQRLGTSHLAEPHTPTCHFFSFSTGRFRCNERTTLQDCSDNRSYESFCSSFAPAIIRTKIYLQAVPLTKNKYSGLFAFIGQLIPVVKLPLKATSKEENGCSQINPELNKCYLNP